MSRENLFEVIGRYQAELSRLSDLDIPPEAVMDTIESMQGGVEEKLRAVVAYALQLEADAEARRSMARKMQEGADAMERRAESLRMYAQIGLMNSGLTLPLRCPEFTLNLAKLPPSAEVVEPLLPDELVETTITIKAIGRDTNEAALRGLFHGRVPSIESTTKPMKRAVLERLKAGEIMPGAKLAPTAYRLSIR